MGGLVHCLFNFLYKMENLFNFKIKDKKLDLNC